MYETREEYRAILAREVPRLESYCECRVLDGEPGYCPRCGEFGIWDVDTLGFVEEYGNSIYFSTVFNEWRCRICDIRMAKPLFH